MNKSLLFALIGLLLGLTSGFMLANSSYRREQSAAANATAMQAASSGVNPGSAASNGAQAGSPTMEQARTIIDQARKNPNDLAAQRRAIEQFQQIQRPEGALEFLLNANRLQPDDAQTMADLSEAYFFGQKFEEAINWSRRALKQRPDFPMASFYLMASLVESRQQLDEAERLLAQLEALKPGDPALAEVRKNLNSARQAGAKDQSKTSIAHGPEQSGGKP